MAWLVMPAYSDVEEWLPADLRSKAWEEIEKTTDDEKERNRLFEHFHSRRAAELHVMFERAATAAQREELRGALFESARLAESPAAMMSIGGLTGPERHGITWPDQRRSVALRRLHGIGPILNSEGNERHFTAWRIGHHHIEVTADDDHLLFDSQGRVLACHSTPPDVASHDDRPPCFLADGTVMTNDPLSGVGGVSRFRCIRDGRLIAECPFIPWEGWREYDAAYAADGLSLTLWSPGYRGAANGLLEIDVKKGHVTALPADRIIGLWPAARGDALRGLRGVGMMVP